VPKCFKLSDYIQWTGDNLPAIQSFVAQWAGDAQYTNNDGELTINIPAVPQRILPVGGIMVTPYLETYPSIEAFQESYGVVGG